MIDDLHITRARRWTVSSKKPIKLGEWLEYLGKDPSLVHAKNDGVARWDRPEGPVWFLYWNGRIQVRSSTDDAVQKAMSIAAELDARVLDESGRPVLA